MIEFQRSLENRTHTLDQNSERFLVEFKSAIGRGDPIAGYQALVLCAEKESALPEWLVDHLLELLTDYHLGNKPSWKGNGKRPLIIIRRRLEEETRHRAVAAVTDWVADKRNYQKMPTVCIRLWINGYYKHSYFKNKERIYDFASLGLKGIRLQNDGPELKCSARTLRRTMKQKKDRPEHRIPIRVAELFGLKNPDEFFGLDKQLADLPD